MAKIVTDYLDEAVYECPTSIVYTDEFRSISFEELRKEALRISTSIICREICKKPIAILLPRSIDCISSIWGIMYSGNFFSILNYENPHNYIIGLIDRLEPAIIVTNREIERILRGKIVCDILIVEEIINDVSLDAKNTKDIKILSSDLCCLIFTSGSTGEPKGVVTNHYALTEAVESWTNFIKLSQYSVIASQLPLYYAASMWCDIITCVKCRTHMYLIPSDFFKKPAKLLEFLCEKEITNITWSVAPIRLLTDFLSLKTMEFPLISKIVVGGEVLSVELANKLKSFFPHSSIISVYGSTETAGAMYSEPNWDYVETGVIPLKNAFDNTQIIIIPDDTNGELYELFIKSTSLVQGYYKNIKLTNEVFVQNPLHKEYIDLVFKTGDLFRKSKNGELVYVGRRDFQVKKLGNIVNLNEIEKIVNSLKGIKNCGCIYDKPEIVLFYEGVPNEREVWKYLRSMLPLYMIPDQIKMLDYLPYTKSGKIDRQTLKTNMLMRKGNTK